MSLLSSLSQLSNLSQYCNRNFTQGVLRFTVSKEACLPSGRLIARQMRCSSPLLRCLLAVLQIGIGIPAAGSGKEG